MGSSAVTLRDRGHLFKLLSGQSICPIYWVDLMIGESEALKIKTETWGGWVDRFWVH